MTRELLRIGLRKTEGTSFFDLLRSRKILYYVAEGSFLKSKQLIQEKHNTLWDSCTVTSAADKVLGQECKDIGRTGGGF